MRRIGVHTSIANGLHMALKRAFKLGCSTVQIFSHNPRAWRFHDISKEEAGLFKKLRVEFNLSPVFIHASYLINLSSASEKLFKKSISLLREEMGRAAEISADYVILHMHGGEIKRVVKGLKEAFKESGWDAGLLLENTAGRKDKRMVIKDMAEIMEMTGYVSGICIDTCHAFQDGYDIRMIKEIDRLYNEIERHIGIDKIKLIHLNDSKADFDLHSDRHEHIGKGCIGVNGLKMFTIYKRFSEIPIILETPKKEEADDIRNLREVHRMLPKILSLSRCASKRDRILGMLSIIAL